MIKKIKSTWYMIKDVYYVQKRIPSEYAPSATGEILEPITEGSDPWFLSITQTSHEWSTDPRKATQLGFFTALLWYYTIKRLDKKKQFEYSLAPVGDIMFIYHVTGKIRPVIK